MAVQSLGAAAQNMLLAAYDLGLDAGWMCAPLFCPEEVVEALALDQALVPHACSRWVTPRETPGAARGAARRPGRIQGLRGAGLLEDRPRAPDPSAVRYHCRSRITWKGRRGLEKR